MAKQVCIDCGKEVGLTQQVQLADKQYICRDCKKKTIKYFEPIEHTADEYRAHVKQCIDGEKLYMAYFKKNHKMKKALYGVWYDPGTALVCITHKDGLFGKATYNVLRVADLDLYERATKFSKGFQGKNVPENSMMFTFRNVEGLSCYMIEGVDDGALKNATKVFDEVFNGKGFFSRAKADFKKGQDKAMAAAGLAQGFKTIMSGDALKTGEADDALMAGAAQMEANMDAVFYAGRDELIQKADAAIKAVLG